MDFYIEIQQLSHPILAKGNTQRAELFMWLHKIIGSREAVHLMTYYIIIGHAMHIVNIQLIYCIIYKSSCGLNNYSNYR